MNILPSEMYSQLGRKKHFYSIMPIENIPSVVENGILSYNNAKKIKHVSIALDEVQRIRNNKTVDGGMPLHDYVNLYFDFHNPMLYKRKDEAEKLCILAISVQVLDLDGVMVTDQNAAKWTAKFMVPELGISEIDFSQVFAIDWNDSDYYVKQQKRAIKCAEILVPQYVEYEYIKGAYVLNEGVRYKMEEMGFLKRIVVKPSVFYQR